MKEHIQIAAPTVICQFMCDHYENVANIKEYVEQSAATEIERYTSTVFADAEEDPGLIY